MTAATATRWAAAAAVRLTTRMATRLPSVSVPLPAAALFTAAVWVLRALAIIAGTFVALRIASWLI